MRRSPGPPGATLAHLAEGTVTQTKSSVLPTMVWASWESCQEEGLPVPQSKQVQRADWKNDALGSASTASEHQVWLGSCRARGQIPLHSRKGSEKGGARLCLPPQGSTLVSFPQPSGAGI